MNATQKKVVLGVLFVFPIVVYLFFALGKNNFAKLPTLSENVALISSFKSLENRDVQLENRITVLGYWGGNINAKKAEALNLNQKIYKRFYEFKDFQFVIVVEEGVAATVEALKTSLAEGVGTDLLKWNFIEGSKEAIEAHFKSLDIPYELDEKHSTPFVFIVDKNSNLRGRRDDGVLYGYNAQSVAELNNKMVDDVKVILAEYRLALKKYNSIHN